MSSIDSRVVEMRFDNGQFEDGIKQTLSSLDTLKKGLSLTGASKGLGDVATAAQNVSPSLSGIASGVDNISSKFNAFGAIGFSVLQNLTSSAMNFGSNLLSSIVDPLVQGGKTRALTIEQAKFQFQGLGMDVAATMANARTAVLGTAYSLADAAKAASMFGASGIKAGPQMVSSLRAIAGVAAMTGSSYSDISDVFTSVAGQGRLMGQDLLRLSDRGINAAATLAKSLGKTEPQIRDMVTAGQISFKQFSDAMDGAFGAHAQDANKTFAGSLANMQAALARLGAEVAAPAYEAQRKVFNALTPVIDNIHAALLPLISAFGTFLNLNSDKLVTSLKSLDFTGLTKSIPSVLGIIKNVFSAIGAILAPIKNAFQEIFPPGAGKPIEDIAKTIEVFSAKLIIGETTANNLRRTFAGVFAVFDIGWQILKKVINMFSDLFHSTGVSSGGILDFTGNIGDFLVKVDEAIKRGTGLTTFFNKLETVLEIPIALVKGFGVLLQSAFDKLSGVDTGGIDALGTRLQKSFAPLTKLGDMITWIWTKVGTVFKAVWGFFEPMASAMATGFENLTTRISDAMKGMKTGDVLGMMNTGLFAAGLLMIRNFETKVVGLFTGQSKFTVIASLKATITQLTNSLRVMQNSLKAGTLLMLAAAVALLAASVVALSLIDPKKLASALTGLAMLFTQLFVAMTVFQKIAAKGGGLQMLMMAAGMILLAIAVDILVSAVKKMSDLNWNELSKGLLGVTVLLGGLSVAVKAMSGNNEKMVSTGAGLLLLAIGIKILVSAVTDLSGLSWADMSKGLVGVGVLLGSLALFTKFAETDKGGISQGIGLILLATGVKILASAMGVFAALSWEDIAKGLVGMAGGLAIMALALKLMPPSSLLSAAAILIVASSLGIIATALGAMGGMSWEAIGKGLVSLAGALGIIAAALALLPPSTLLSAAAILIVASSLGLIANALGTMGGMSWEVIGKGLIVLAGSLGIIAIAMYAMTGALPGAAALLVIAASLAVLAPILMVFGNMSWEQMGKSLLMLAGVFAVLGIAGLLLTPMVPTLLSLGMAVLLLGVGMLTAGVGLSLFSVGLTALSISGAAGIATLVAIVAGLVGLIPMVIQKVGQGLILLVIVIAQSSAAITQGITVILQALITSIATLTPLIITTLMRLIVMLLAALVVIAPQLIEAGWKILQDLLTGIQNHIGDITTTVANIIVNFLTALTAALPRLTTAGVNFIVALCQGIAANIGTIVTSATNVMVNFLNGLANNIGRIITAGANLIVKFIEGIAGNLSKIITAGADLIVKFLEGISDPKNIANILDAAATCILNFINGLSTAIDKHSTEIGKAAGKLMVSLGRGLKDGFGAAIREVANGVGGPMGFLLGKMADALGAKSPSTKTFTFGMDLAQGISNGLTSYSGVAEKSAEGVGHATIESMRKSISGMSDLMSEPIDINPTITPVLDLTNVQKGAGQLGSMLTTKPISVGTTYSNANTVSTGLTLPANSAKTLADTLTAALAAKPVTTTKTTPRPVEFHIGTIQDGDSLLRRARAANTMVSLAEGGDSTQIVGLGI